MENLSLPIHTVPDTREIRQWQTYKSTAEQKTFCSLWFTHQEFSSWWADTSSIDMLFLWYGHQHVTESLPQHRWQLMKPGVLCQPEGSLTGLESVSGSSGYVNSFRQFCWSQFLLDGLFHLCLFQTAQLECFSAILTAHIHLGKEGPSESVQFQWLPKAIELFTSWA